MKNAGRASGLLVLCICLAGLGGCGPRENSDTALRIEVSFLPEVHGDPITGRAYVVFADSDRREPRFQVSTNGVPFFGADIERLAPGTAAVFKGTEPGYPIERLADLPAGDYFVQGFINVYTEFRRADGHTLWMHKDQWEGPALEPVPRQPVQRCPCRAHRSPGKNDPPAGMFPCRPSGHGPGRHTLRQTHQVPEPCPLRVLGSSHVFGGGGAPA